MRKHYAKLTSEEEQIISDFSRRFLKHRAVRDAQKDLCIGALIGAAVGLTGNLVDLYINRKPKSCRKR